jgi:hypothetical protein
MGHAALLAFSNMPKAYKDHSALYWLISHRYVFLDLRSFSALPLKSRACVILGPRG